MAVTHRVGKRDESVNAERATVVHVDPQAVADIQQAMQDDLAWRGRGRRDRTVSLPPVLPAPVSRVVLFRGGSEPGWAR